MTSIFEGERVRLRAPEPRDDAMFYQWDMTDTDGARLLYTIPFPRPQPTPSSEYKPMLNENFPFTIETLAGEVCGSIHIHDSDPRFGTFKYGIAIFPEHRGKGCASDAIRLVLRYYFFERRYQKCNVDVYTFNEGSKRLHESLGFVLEGQLRRMIYAQGELHDVMCFGITREEFEASVQGTFFALKSGS